MCSIVKVAKGRALISKSLMMYVVVHSLAQDRLGVRVHHLPLPLSGEPEVLVEEGLAYANNNIAGHLAPNIGDTPSKYFFEVMICFYTFKPKPANRIHMI